MPVVIKEILCINYLLYIEIVKYFSFQILFIAGLACVIGLERTFRFFFQKHKVKASVAFFGGIFVVLLGWPLLGMLIETYGFVLLFRYVVFTFSCDNLMFSKLWIYSHSSHQIVFVPLTCFMLWIISSSNSTLLLSLA